MQCWKFRCCAEANRLYMVLYSVRPVEKCLTPVDCKRQDRDQADEDQVLISVRVELTNRKRYLKPWPALVQRAPESPRL